MEMEQNQPQNYQSNETYIRGMAQQADSSFLIYQLETDEVLESIEMNLKGYDWDPKERKYIQKRLMMVNSTGISVLMTVLKSEIDKHKMLSDFDEEEISRIMIEFEENIVDILRDKYKEWQIDPKLMSTIRIMIGNAVHATYKRALDGGERKFLKGETKRVETFSEREKSPTIIGSILKPMKSKW